MGLCGTSVCGFATALDQNGEIVCFGPTTSEVRPPWTSCIGGTGAASCLADSACSDNPGIIVWYACCLELRKNFANEDKKYGFNRVLLQRRHLYRTGSRSCLVR